MDERGKRVLSHLVNHYCDPAPESWKQAGRLVSVCFSYKSDPILKLDTEWRDDRQGSQSGPKSVGSRSPYGGYFSYGGCRSRVWNVIRDSRGHCISWSFMQGCSQDFRWFPVLCSAHYHWWRHLRYDTDQRGHCQCESEEEGWEGRVTVHIVKRLRCLFHVYPNNFTCQFQRCLLAGAQRILAFDSLCPSMIPDEPTKETNLSNASLLQSAKKHGCPLFQEDRGPFMLFFYLLLI